VPIVENVRTPDRRLVRDVAAVGVADTVVAVSYGAIAVAAGLPTWAIVAMSMLLFAGGAQFLATALISAGNPVAAVAGGLLLNARHLPFGLAVADVLAPPSTDARRGLLRRLVGSHLMVDESVAFALAQDDPARRRSAYWLTGASLFVLWNAGTALGILLGGAVGDPARFGLDAAFPAGLIALLMPTLRESRPRRVALVGACAALLATPVLPAGLPVLLALVGLVAFGRSRVEAAC
jgi:4-azaleucine resistance transporter AzlC